MLKLRDKIACRIVGSINMNPEKKDRVVKKFRHAERLSKFIPHIVKRGFIKERFTVGEAKLELYKKRGLQPKNLVCIIHGGGFIMGLTNAYRNLVYPICKACPDTAVALVDYRTAPKNTYPLAHDDVYASLKYLSDELKFCRSNTILFGDSAGGNLALSTMLKLRDNKEQAVRAAVLLSPWTDLTASGESHYLNYKTDIIFGRKKSTMCDKAKQRLLKSAIFSYAGAAARDNAYLSPAFNTFEDLPEMLFIAGTAEMLLSDTLSVVEKIKEAGGRAELILGEGMFHVYPLFKALSPTAKQHFTKAINFIANSLSTV